MITAVKACGKMIAVGWDGRVMPLVALPGIYQSASPENLNAKVMVREETVVTLGELIAV